MSLTTARDEGILRCFAGTEQYAFRTADVRHVARAEQLRDDAADDGRVGALKLGGQHVPVYSLARVLGRPGANEPVTGDQHVAVTGDRDELAGWLVDRIARTASPERDAIAPIPRTLGSPATKWFEALVTFGDNDSALLISPRHLNPRSNTAPEHDDAPAFDTPPFDVRAGRAEPVAMLFSSGSLPASAARRYALSGRQIAGVVQSTTPIPVPGAADHVLGVTRWRDAVVPIIEFRRDGTSDASRRRLIAQGGPPGSLVAFSIDTEMVMHRPAEDQRLRTDVECPPFCSGMFDVNGEVVGLLDLDSLLLPSGR